MFYGLRCSSLHPSEVGGYILSIFLKISWQKWKSSETVSNIIYNLMLKSRHFVRSEYQKCMQKAKIAITVKTHLATMQYVITDCSHRIRLCGYQLLTLLKKKCHFSQLNDTAHILNFCQLKPLLLKEMTVNNNTFVDL